MSETSKLYRMKRMLPVLSCFLLPFITIGQVKVDTVLDKGIYQSFFNYSLKEPLYVSYTLYKGGGQCSRSAKDLQFKQDDFEGAARASDYTHNSYDKGHLANAEDFAGDCDKEEMTFRYYNCVPQTARLNRGIWKTWEEKVRELSQTEKLFIVAGCIYGKKTLGKDKIGVPSYCYKIVLNAETQQVLYCLLFPNNKTNTYQAISLADLKKQMGYDLMPASYWSNK